MNQTEKFRLYATEINSVIDRINRSEFNPDDRVYAGEKASILVLALAETIVKISDTAPEALQITENFFQSAWDAVDTLLTAKARAAKVIRGITTKQ